MNRYLLSVAFVVCLTMPAYAQNWPQFRGERASGVGTGEVVHNWNAETGENILWKTAIPGVAHSSPIVWGDRIFLTTAVSERKTETRFGLYGDVAPVDDNSEHRWLVLAFDKNSGKIIWEREVRRAAPRGKRHPKSSLATPTPVTNGEVVVAFFGSEGLYALDLDGKLLWEKDLGVLSVGWFYDPDYEWGFAASPVIYKGLVIVQADTQDEPFVAAFDLKTGKEVWRTLREEIPSFSSPTIYEGEPRDELITQATRFIRGYDPATGEELWRLSGNSEITTPTPIVHDGTIYITNGYRGVQPIYAVRPGGSGDLTLGEGESSSEFIRWSTRRGGPYTPTPVIYGGLLFVCKNNGVISAYDAATGERYFETRLAGKGGSFSASPVAADGRIFFFSEDGDAFAIRAGKEYELLSENPMGEPIMATPAVSDGVIYVRTVEHLFAVGVR